MASSLDKLSSNLKIDQFVNLMKYYSGHQLSLLLRKGVYPYDYVDCMKKFDEINLPPKEDFFLKSRVKVLQMKTTNMIKQFGMNLILSQWRITTTYTILSDVLLLADVFENFREYLHESLWIGSCLVLQCARSCLGCCIRNYKGSTRITKRTRHVANDWKWYQRRNRNNITASC